jgi:hypothetical protein
VCAGIDKLRRRVNSCGRMIMVVAVNSGSRILIESSVAQLPPGGVGLAINDGG